MGPHYAIKPLTALITFKSDVRTFMDRLNVQLHVRLICNHKNSNNFLLLLRKISVLTSCPPLSRTLAKIRNDDHLPQQFKTRLFQTIQNLRPRLEVPCISCVKRWPSYALATGAAFQLSRNGCRRRHCWPLFKHPALRRGEKL